MYIQATGAPVMMDFGNMFEPKASAAPALASEWHNSSKNSASINGRGNMNPGISSSRPQTPVNYDDAQKPLQYPQNANAANHLNVLHRPQDPSSYLGEYSPERGLINTTNGIMGEQYYQPVSQVHMTSGSGDNYAINGNHVNNFPVINNYDSSNRELGPPKQGRRCRSPKEAFERGQYWKGQARPGSACLDKWKSHLLRDDDPNRIHPQQYASNAMKVMAGGGEYSNLSPKAKAIKNKEVSKGLRENIIPLPDPYWG